MGSEVKRTGKRVLPKPISDANPNLDTTYTGNVMSKSASRREREKEILNKTILQAAREVLVNQGHEAISIRLIAEMIEYSPSAIYLHFKDRGAILQALIDEGFDELSACTRKVKNPGIADGVHQMGLNYIEFAVQNPRLYELMFHPGAPEDQECRRRMTDSPPDCFVALLEAVEAGQAAKVFTRLIPVPVLAYSLWGQVHGIASIAIARQFFWIPDEQISLLFRESTRAMIVGLQP